MNLITFTYMEEFFSKSLCCNIAQRQPWFLLTLWYILLQITIRIKPKTHIYHHISWCWEIYSSTYDWPIIMAARPLLKLGLGKISGTDFNISVWNEPWIPDTVVRPPRAYDWVTYIHPYSWVIPLLDMISRIEILLSYKIFLSWGHSFILDLRHSHTWSMGDHPWNHTKSKVYSVKFIYDLLGSEETIPIYIGLFVFSGFLLEYLCLPKHRFSVLEKKDVTYT